MSGVMGYEREMNISMSTREVVEQQKIISGMSDKVGGGGGSENDWIGGPIILFFVYAGEVMTLSKLPMLEMVP